MNVSDWIVTAGALVAVLDYFGIKPKKALWGFSMPTSRRWKLGVMLVLVAASLGMSGYSAYRQSRPRMERIIEKPVDRIVERTVETPCPTPEGGATKTKTVPPSSTNTVTNPTGSIVNQNSPNFGSQTINQEPLTWYTFDGSFHTRNGSTFSAIAGPETGAYVQMSKLENSGDWQSLSKYSEQMIATYPKWWTPYLLAGEAHKNLGEIDKAIDRLDKGINLAGAPNVSTPAYNTAVQMLNELKSATRH